jgi:hypothetical protein
MSDLIGYLAARSVRRRPLAAASREPPSELSVQPRLPSLYESKSVIESGGAEPRTSEDESHGFLDLGRSPLVSQRDIAEFEPKRPTQAARSASRIAEPARDRFRVHEAEPAAGLDAAAPSRPYGAPGTRVPPATDGSTRRVADIQRLEAPRPPLVTAKSAPHATDVRRMSSEDEAAPGIDGDKGSEPTTSKSSLTQQVSRESTRDAGKTFALEKATASLPASPTPDATVGPASRHVMSPTPAPIGSPRLNPSPLSGTAPMPPRVQVTIGRIEIRATQSQPPQPPPQRRELRMSLEEYLAKRERG